jgi:hypothetical protein
MSEKPRKGSMAAADAKEEKIAKYCLTGLTFLVFMCAYVFNTDLNMFVERQGFVAHLIGVILYLTVPGFFFYGEKVVAKISASYEVTSWTHVIVWLLGTAFGTIVSAGFNFGY